VDTRRHFDRRDSTLFATITLGVVFQSADGRVTAANPAAERILGLPLERMQGQDPAEPPWRAVREDGADLPKEQHPSLLALRTGREVRDVVLGVHTPAREELTWLSVSAVPLVRAGDDAPCEILTSFTDITDRKRAEDALRESEERYQRITEGLTDYLYTVDVHDGRAVGTVHSQACEVVTGYTRGEFAADTYLWIRMVVPEDRERVIAHVGRILAGERVAPLEHRIVRKDGRVRWVLDTTIAHTDAAGRLVSYDGVVNDITGRKEAEEALRQRDRQLVEAQRIAHLGFYDLDTATGAWTSSEVLDDIFGIDADFVHDLDGWISLIHPKDRRQVSDYFTGEVLTRQGNFDREYRIIRRTDGRELWVHGLGVLQLGADGRPRRMFGTIHDITDRKRAELLDLELERRLLHAQKLQSLGVMAGGIAHDFNNLLTGLMGNLDLALMNVGLPDDVRSRIERAHQTAGRAAELAGQMLAYSGRGLFVVVDLDLSTFLLQNVQLLKATISKTVTLNLQLDRELPGVRVDLDQFRQVVLNLLANASEAIGDTPGVVTIATGAIDCDREYLDRSVIELKPPLGRFVWLDVSDTGGGMDAETRQRMFDPFFSTKFTGRGLGLSAVLGIVTGHGGAITVDSAVGRGTTVRVLLPAVEEAGPGAMAP
jgi:two-component system cell cycle sensor histidine kinase/response regulator CckA